MQDRVSGFQCLSLYSILAEEDWPGMPKDLFVNHYPCSARRDSELQRSVDRLAGKAELNFCKDSIKCNPLYCCLSNSRSNAAKKAKLRGRELLTYCANCVKNFQKDLHTRHVLQLLFKSGREFQTGSFVRKFQNYRLLKQLIQKN